MPDSPHIILNPHNLTVGLVLSLFDREASEFA